MNLTINVNGTFDLRNRQGMRDLANAVHEELIIFKRSGKLFNGPLG